LCFTHNDPFEDTESSDTPAAYTGMAGVSPTTIRSRILKDYSEGVFCVLAAAFHPQRSVRGY